MEGVQVTVPGSTAAVLPPTGPASGHPPPPQTVQKKRQQISEEEKREKAIRYFATKRVSNFLDALLTAMYEELPQDPFEWCVNFLTVHSTMHSIQQRQNERQGGELPADARRYAALMKIPFMMDELLADILRNEPVDVDRHALSWFKWNKTGFLARQFQGEAPVFEPRQGA
eukprot:Hpha_TRINITY_DN670_c0_g1::TRINITY_DN670_c0_g1_i1::g.21278::m.21278